MPVEEELFMLGADLLVADRRLAASNPGDHLPNIYGIVVVVVRQGRSVPCLIPRELRPGASEW
jgi:hypothetical protein